MSVRLHLFGSPTVDSSGELHALPFERRSQLLVFLALKRSWVGRAELAAMLWPEQTARLAHANLRKTLFRLQSVAWGTRIELQGPMARLEAQSDVFEFESALREQRVAEALPLYRGDLLAGFDDMAGETWTSWLGFERERLRNAWRGAALHRAAGDIDPTEGIALSARLLEADPLDEAALRLHLQWLARQGQHGRARQVWRDFVERLKQDLGLLPGPELQSLHDRLAAGFATSAPVVPAAPPPLDSGFVGRSAELRQIAGLLAQDDCRLLSLIGPGGVGKTRLARRAMRDLTPDFADGVAFVALEEATTAGELAGRLAREIGVDPAGAAEPLVPVIEFLRGRQMLLVLDNFEQLAAAAPMVEALVQSCPRLRILVTTRIRLAVASEWSFPLEGLPFPEPGDEDRIEAFDATRLFVNAARRVEPALIPAAQAAAIVDICRQVEGLPLALELAAVWTRVLSCEAIAAELRHGIELLRAVDPARPSRHASIEVVFDQSWRLLSAIERDALARLSVFRGGFSAEAARTVAAASLPVLGALADKSLLRKEDARTFLHPLVHQLAAERLGDGDLFAATQAAHANYFHHLLAHLRRAVERGDREALAQIDAEFENCRAAWRWAVAQGQSETLAGSTMTLLHFCDHRGRFEEGRSLLREAIESRPVAAGPGFEPLLASGLAHLEYRLDLYGDAQATAARALAGSRSSRDHDARLQSFKVLGGCCLQLGKYDDARRYFKQALELSISGTDPRNAAAMLDNLALIEKATGRYGESERMSMQALMQYRLLANVAGEAPLPEQPRHLADGSGPA